jgi:Tol biopolymer transport system component
LGGNIQSPWSPDGRKLIFSQNTINDEKHQFYALDIATQDTNPLTTETGKYYSPTWSPDGEHIAFILDETQENSPILRRLYIIDSQGNHHVNVTEGLPEYESVALADYYWSPDGQSITFVTDSPAGKSKPIVYKADLDGTRVQQTSSNAQILDWWNGIVVQTDPPKKVEETSLSLLRADGSQIPLQTCQSNDLPASYAIKRSSDGTLAFGMKCTQGVWMLYGVNAEGTTINKLLNSPLDARYDNLFQMTWSPDDHFLAFVAFDFDDKHIPTDLYVVIANDPSASPLKMENSSDPSWQPVLAENLLKEVSTPKPAETVSASGLIAFTAVGKNGDMDIFTVHPNGSGLTNLTNDPAIESNIAWSPDGTRLAFVSDSDGNDNIFVMNADGSDQKRLTDEPESNLAPLWSPDGQRIAYSLSDPDEKTVNLFVMDSNGENRRRLTDRHTSPDMMGVWAEEWSLDGNYIFYLDQQLISRVDIESGEITKVSPETDWPSYLLVKADSKIRFLSPCGQDSAEFCSKVKMIGEDGAGEETYQTMKLQRVCTSADPGNFYYMAKWSPDLNKILFVFSCSQDGGLFYIANGDGSDFKSVNEPGSFLYKDIHFDWSPDSQSIIFTSSPDVPHTQDLYLLNIEAALQDPGIKPSRLNLSFAQAGDLVWQPAP